MKRLTKLPVAVAILVSALSTVDAQPKHPDFSGEWRPANSQKSAAGLSITQDGAEINVKDSSGTRTYKLDGSPTLYNLNGTLAAANTKPDDAPVKTTAKWAGARLTL